MIATIANQIRNYKASMMLGNEGEGRRNEKFI
jgi:hypothetical protein